MRLQLLVTFSCSLLVLAAGCGGGTTDTPDSGGGNDAGTLTPDTGGDVDSGTTDVDSGTTDVDSGTTDVDSGTTDVDSGGTTGDACTNAADMMIISTEDVTGTVGDCAMSSIGMEPALMTCIVDGTGLSAPCAGCYDASVHCIFDHCLSMCIGGDTPACQACRMEFCDADFDACSGL